MTALGRLAIITQNARHEIFIKLFRKFHEMFGMEAHAKLNPSEGPRIPEILGIDY